jgi:hypothetical protein
MKKESPQKKKLFQKYMLEKQSLEGSMDTTKINSASLLMHIF